MRHLHEEASLSGTMAPGQADGPVVGPMRPPAGQLAPTAMGSRPAATGSRSEPCSAPTVPSTTPRPSARRWQPKGSPTCASRPARRITTPWWNASTRPSSKRLAARLPSPVLHLGPSTPGRGRRLAHYLQPTPSQPRRLDARPDSSRNSRQPQAQQGSMRTISHHRGHLSSRLPVRKC